MNNKSAQKGSVLVQTLVFAAIAALLMTSLGTGAAAAIKASKRAINREQAIQIAEAGIEYYRWHLAHAPEDFQDGTGGPGPYVHEFVDKEGERIGEFELDITAPQSGSTIVSVESTGRVDADPGLERAIVVQFAIPSLAKFAVVANDEMRFGEGTEVYGPIHSNQGIRFDGLAHNIISSAVERYNDPDHSGNDEHGVHTHVAPVDPQPPAPAPVRTDVFEAGRQFPVPAVDFVGITSDLSQMKADAIASGFHRGSSGGLGYHVVLNTNDTFRLYRVNSLVAVPNGCTNVQGQQDWGTWSIRSNGETLLGTYAFPQNGILFFEDHVWVNGQISTARLTIAAARFPDNPAQRRNIVVNNDLLYTNYDGRDVIALMAQGDLTVGLVSEDDLRIDAAIIAQNGRVGRHYYRPPSGGSQRCSPYHIRQRITLNGMIGTYQRYGFAYTDDTGYQERNIIYDANLLYGPPPSFPLTSDNYEVISWKEVRS